MGGGGGVCGLPLLHTPMYREVIKVYFVKCCYLLSYLQLMECQRGCVIRQGNQPKPSKKKCRDTCVSFTIIGGLLHSAFTWPLNGSNLCVVPAIGGEVGW